MDRADKAVELFKSGYNCAQAVVGAFCEELGMDKETALRASEGFGGGMGRMRLTCGTVSAMAFLAGLKYSKAQAGDLETRTLVYETVRKMAGEFEKKNGSIICSELLGASKPNDNGARPEARTQEYYKKRPCAGCVLDAAKIVEEILMSE